MKKILFTILFTLAPMAFADIPAPPAPSDDEVTVVSISGDEAAELNSSLAGVTIRGSSLRTAASSYNVFRSTNGLLQAVCETWTYTSGKAPKTTCEIKKSNNGKAPPAFKPRIVMG